MSSTPTATERSPWPPGFSLPIMAAHALCGSMTPCSSTIDSGAASRRRGMKPSRRITAVGVEAEADHRLAVAAYVRDDRDDACRHRAEVDERVADRRRDRRDVLAYLHDAHAALPFGPFARDELVHHLELAGV